MMIEQKLKIKPNLDQLILTIMLLQVMIIPWISSSLADLVNYILVGLIAASLAQDRHFFRTICFALLIVFVIYQVINYCILRGSLQYLLRNWFRTFKSIVIIIYVTNLIRIKPLRLFTFLDKCSILFNIYAIVNIPLLLIQRSHDFRTTTLKSLLGKISYKGSAYYSKDMMSGLFGLYGTPRLTMFITFLLLYNFMKNHKNGKRVSKSYSVLNTVLCVFYLWMAAQNDNKGFYIILLLFIIVLYFAYNEEKVRSSWLNKSLSLRRMSTVLKACFVVIGILIITGIFYNKIDAFKDVVDMSIRKIQEGLLWGAYSDYVSVVGGGERFAMILYALSKPESAFIGFGLGNYIYTSGNLGFTHFGQADVGTFICLGGSIYIILMFAVIYQGFKRNFRGTFFPKILLIIFMILSIYTHVVMDTSITISIMMIYAVCWYVIQGQGVGCITRRVAYENRNYNML